MKICLLLINSDLIQLHRVVSSIYIKKVSTCPNQPHDDWVYYEFPTQCNKAVKYTFLSGNTVVLEEACSQLYPAVITSTFTDSSDPTPLINNEVCNGGNIVYIYATDKSGTFLIICTLTILNFMSFVNFFDCVESPLTFYIQ